VMMIGTKMAENSWRDVWSPFRVKLIEETARCLSNQQAEATRGERPRWDELTEEEQFNLVENLARVSLAVDEAMHNLTEQGLIV
jgi:hypothetical protein